MNATLGGELTSTEYDVDANIRRGYYPDRGYSFADIDPAMYTAYASWLSYSGKPIITKGLTNLAAAYITAAYIYNDTYILSANTRSDFSNAFGNRSNERFLPTWSVSGRWNMQNSLLKNIKWLQEAAFRISYGTQGNILPYQTPNTIILKGSMNSFYRSFESYILAYPNPNLKWERTDSYNAGLDFSLFNNKLRGTVGFFYKRTNNAFLSKEVSLMNGTSGYVVNAGILENRGLELALNITPINTTSIGGNGKRGFVWRIDPQLGSVFNKLLDAALKPNEKVVIDPSSFSYESYLRGVVPVNGKSVNTFYAYRFKGLDHNGRPVLYGAEPENANELIEKYTNMAPSDVYFTLLTEVGRREPVIQGGVSNYIGYRNWSLNFTVAYSLGNKIRLLRIASGAYGTSTPSLQQNMRKEFVNRWRYPGDEAFTDIPGINNDNTIPWWKTTSLNLGQDYYQMYDDADIRVVNGNYLKLQSMDVSYNFSQELCRKLGVKATSLSLSGSNLFTIANKALRGQDPSQSGSTSNINLSIRPVYSFNINLSL